MAVAYGFKLENGVFFNCEVSEDERQRLSGGKLKNGSDTLVSWSILVPNGSIHRNTETQ